MCHVRHEHEKEKENERRNSGHEMPSGTLENQLIPTQEISLLQLCANNLKNTFIMRKIWLFLTVICLCTGLYARPAAAAYLTGGELAAICQSKNSEDIFSCLNYVSGVIDYHVFMQSL